jgi:hypothetical protein
MRALPATLLCAALPAYADGGTASDTATAPIAETVIDARLDVAHRALSGGERVSFVNPGPEALRQAYLWLYPNRFETEPRALNDVNFHWLYPRRFDPGFMRLASVEVAGRAARFRARSPTLVEIDLPAPVAAGEALAIDVTWHLAVPQRFGAFGCVEDGCALAGGFYPMLAALRPDGAGWALDDAPMRSRFSGSLVVEGGGDAMVGGVRRRGDVVPLDGGPAAFLPVVVAPWLHESVRVHKGVTIGYLARESPPPAGDAARQILAYTLEDRDSMVLDTVERVVDLLEDIRAPFPQGTRLTLVAAPLRLDLALAEPGMVLVSDRLFELFPARRFRKFHERELARAVLTEWLERRLGTATAEAAAAWLTDLYTVRAYRKEEFARDVLAPVSFVPAVDNLLYAPQVAFAEAYFGNVADGDPFRDDPRRAPNQRPRGGLLFEKLRDLLSPAELTAAMRAVLLEGQPLEVAAEAAAGRKLDWFFRQWAGPYPAVDYRLGPRRVRRVGPRSWRHEIAIEKLTPSGGEIPVEPVEVAATDETGRRELGRWNGEGTRGEVELVAASPDLAAAEIDPRGRLVEQRIDGAPDDPKLDDRDPAEIKFLYNGFGALLDFSNLTVGLLLDFGLRRVHDVRHSARLQLFSSNQVTVGGAVGYQYHFGRVITPLRLSRAVDVTATVSRLDPGFGDAPSAATRISLGASVGYDDRLFVFEPKHALSWVVGARYTLTRFDAEAQDLLRTYSFFGGLTHIFTPVGGNTLVLNLDAAVVAGDVLARSQLAAAGGAGGLRGYGPAELFGRARILGHLEWRGVMSHDLDWNFGQLFMVRGITAAAFLDAGAVSGCVDAGDLLASDNLLADAGFGFRIIYDNFGVQPGVTSIDVAVPLVLRPRTCLGHETVNLSGGRPPVMVFLTFLPPF